MTHVCFMSINRDLNFLFSDLGAISLPIKGAWSNASGGMGSKYADDLPL